MANQERAAMGRNLVVCVDGASNVPEADGTDLARLFDMTTKDQGQLTHDESGGTGVAKRSTLCRVLAGLLMGALLSTLVACAGQPAERTTTSGPSASTEQLPLQESGLAVGGDVEASVTKVGEFPATEAELKTITEACERAQGIPIDGDDPCAEVTEGPPFRPCGPFDICVEIFSVESPGFASAGYFEVSDRRQTDSLCESVPGAVCLRVGLTAQALAELTTVTPTPTETPTPTTTPTPTPTTTPTPTPTTSLTPTTETPAPTKKPTTTTHTDPGSPTIAP